MKLGFECKLLRGEPGVPGSIGTLEVKTVKDVALTYAHEQVEANNRSSQFKRYVSGMIDSGIEVNFDYDTTDIHCMAFLEAAVENSMLSIYVELEESFTMLVDPFTVYAGIGLDADFEIFLNNSDQPLADTQKISFTAKPSARAGREPNFINDPPPIA